MYCVFVFFRFWEIAHSALKNARSCVKIYVQGRKRYKCVYHTCICSETSPDTYIFCNTICLCYNSIILYLFFLLDCEKRWRNATFFMLSVCVFFYVVKKFFELDVLMGNTINGNSLKLGRKSLAIKD